MGYLVSSLQLDCHVTITAMAMVSNEALSAATSWISHKSAEP